MKDVLSRDSFPPDPAFRKGYVFRDFRIKVMADHQHVEMLVDRLTVNGGRIGRRRNDIVFAAPLMMSGMTAARSLGMECMDRSVFEGCDVAPTNPDRSACRCGSAPGRRNRRHGGGYLCNERGAPVFMQLQQHRRRHHLFFQRRRGRHSYCQSQGSSEPAACSIRPICQFPACGSSRSCPRPVKCHRPSSWLNRCRATICCGQMKWIWTSRPPAAAIFPSAAIASCLSQRRYRLSADIWIPALPMAAMRPSFRPISALKIPGRRSARLDNHIRHHRHGSLRRTCRRG